MELVGGGTAEGGGAEGGVCLICHSRDLGLPREPTTFFAKRSSSSSVLSKHLCVYFLLRHVLELPSEQLVKYLRYCPNPENWVKICSSCDKNYVEKCWRIFEELLEVKRKFAGVRHDLIQAVKKSLKVELSQNVREDIEFQSAGFILDIDLETRRFVGKREYFQQSEVSPSIDEDFMARLSSTPSATLETEHGGNMRGLITRPHAEDDDMKPIIASKPGILDMNQSTSEMIPRECEIKEEPTSTNIDTRESSTPNEEGSALEDNHEFCEASLAGNTGDRRLSEIESDVKPMSCPLCKIAVLSKTTLFQHISSCQDDQIVNLKCDHCEDKFISKPVFLNHLGFAHGIMDHLQFHCDIPSCGRAFSRKDFLTKHSSEMHIPKPIVPPERLICKICGKSFKIWTYYQQHMELHQLHGKDLFQCKICGKNLSQSHHLRVHMETVHNPTRKLNKASLSIQKKYKQQMHLLQRHPKCDLCSKTFMTKGGLRKHQILIHKTSFYECPKCDWKSSSVEPYILKAHMMRHHGTAEDLKALTCPKCGKTFCQRTVLSLHLSTCQKESRSFVCEHCGKEFLNESSHFNHLGAAHGIKDHLKFHCTFEGCNKSFFTKPDLKRHGAVHKTPQHECSICGVKFKSRTHLDGHILNHKPEAKKTYQCELCPASYGRRDNLLAHMRKGVHNQNGKRKRIQYKCSECELTFGWKSQLESHLEKVHEGKGTVVGLRELASDKTQTFKKRARKNKVIDPDKRFHCEHCGKVFQKKSEFVRHTKRVHGNQDDFKFVCSFEGCGKKFFDKYQLEDHKDKHKDPRRKCEKCGKIFSQLSGLHRHKRRIHREKPEESEEDQGKRKRKPAEVINCEECNLTFAHQKGLRKHNELVHGREPKKEQESFQCEVCQVKFSSKPSLQQHVQVVHERKQEVCCDLCGKILANRNYLKKHNAKVHKIGVEDFQRSHCTVEGCSKSFESKGKLRLHTMRVHKGQRPFQCEQCGKDVISNTHLKRHIKAMHTNKKSKPFKCEECGKGFAISEYLWLHKKTHEKKESGAEMGNFVQR